MFEPARWPVVNAARRLLFVLLVTLFGGCEPGAQPAPESEPDPGPEVLQRITRPVAGATVHLVRLVQRGDEYAFEPAVIRASPGDVVRFVMAGTQPESVAFEAGAATEAAGAFIRTNSLHLGVLLTDSGQAYDVSFADAPAGRYPFVSVPHAIHGMRGEVVIEETAG